MQWMAWTLPTAVFFVAIGLALLLLTLLEIYRPTVPRRGFLPMVTTRGDRFFVSLLVTAYLHVLFLAFSDGPVLVASVTSLCAAVCLMRWG